MPKNTPLLHTNEGHVTQLTLNRPDRRNALSPQLDEQLRTALGEVADDKAVRAVILTGEGTAFCSGADLRAIDSPTPGDIREHLQVRLIPLIEAITNCPKPVIAAINGPAAGAGCALALACDLRIMADAASLSVNFSQIGFVPDMGLSWFLTRHVGYARAFELAAFAKTLSAEECVRIGLVNGIAEPDDLNATAAKLAGSLAKRPAKTVALTKQTLRFAAENSLADTMAYEADQQHRAAQTEEHREGLQAFREKREPRFP